MTVLRPFGWLPVLLLAGLGCSAVGDGDFYDAGARRDTRPTDRPGDTPSAPVDNGPVMCTDTDGDGLSDQVEGAPSVDTDSDGTPDFQDMDSDGDGFNDDLEARRRYPGYDTNARMLTCGQVSDNCDAPPDGIANVRDLDSDNDGLTDAEERMAMTNPCAADTDSDGATDLIEQVARSDPRMGTSRPPENSLYVVLPHYPPGVTGMHEHREFTFATRIRQADVFFLVDNSASMRPIINELRTNFSRVIVPGLRTAIPDMRMGVGSFDSMPVPPNGSPGRPGDYTLWVRQPTTDNATLAQSAFDRMNTIDEDTGGAFYGGDGPECQTEAAFEVIQGDGSPGHESDEAARRSVRNALDPTGNGWVPRLDPARDCMGAERAFGWGCFQEGRVPIVVLASDAAWYDGFFQTVSDPYRDPSSGGRGHDANQLVAALMTRGGFFIGIDVGLGVGGPTYRNSQQVAARTRTLDGMGRPIVFGPGLGGIAAASRQVVEAITTIAGQSRQDISTRTVADAMEMRLPPMRTTADFIKAVTPVRGIPDMPSGYERRDMTTFYNVAPSTQVVFDVDFYNDFQPGGATAQLFTATINVVGRAGTVVDRRPVYIVVPATGGGIPPG